MAGVARHYVTQFGVDGYRVDAVGGSKIVNWNPGDSLRPGQLRAASGRAEDARVRCATR